ncbi:hypothetical protein PN482_11695 [Microcystis aeruginosa CS-555/01A07]|uniref:hypothetical protein n=1 Tax=Microcystis aeruginosa TaxID=1126 RepID=UPI00232BEC0C|nr:hypothetical protein [Microcystis aeruginosa]MDB9429537.1 hypothetical protein [Microcystis aeruginosa CS-555/01A07]
MGIVPLYNKSAGSLADVKNDVKSFINKTRGEGALKIYALGVITGDPTLYHFSKVMTDLVDHFKAQSLSEKGIALSDVSHDY